MKKTAKFFKFFINTLIVFLIATSVAALLLILVKTDSTNKIISDSLAQFSVNTVSYLFCLSILIVAVSFKAGTYVTNKRHKNDIKTLRKTIDSFSFSIPHTDQTYLIRASDSDIEELIKKTHIIFSEVRNFYMSVSDSLKANSITQAKINSMVKNATTYTTSNYLIHDLNNVLTLVYTDMTMLSKKFTILMESLNTEGNELGDNAEYNAVISILNRINASTKKMGDKIKAQQKAISSENKYEDINISELLGQVIYFFRVDLQNHQIRVYSQIENDKYAYGKMFHFFSIFSAVIRNAIESFEYALTDIKRKEISIKLEEKDSLLYISITDNGCGMEDETLKSIFEENFSTKNNHTGNGLSNAQKTIHSFNGKIEVTSNGKYKGTTCIIEIPIV